jgi:hypothetical protein
MKKILALLLFFATPATAQIIYPGSFTVINLAGGNTNLANYLSIQLAPNSAGHKTWTLPNSDGTNGYVLSTDGSGNLSWIDPNAFTGYVQLTPSTAQTILPSADVPPLTLQAFSSTGETDFLKCLTQPGSPITVFEIGDDGEMHTHGGILLDAGAYLQDGSGSQGSAGQVLESQGTGLSPLWTTPSSPGMINPMGALGDMLFENATPAPAALSGNTTTTKEYLSQTGTGSGSAAPAWAQIAFADISGTLPVGQGGTGLGTLTANSVLLGNGTSSPTFVAPGTSGNVLQSNGTTWISSAVPASATAVITNPGSSARNVITPSGGDFKPLVVDNGNATYSSDLQEWDQNGVTAASINFEGILTLGNNAIGSGQILFHNATNAHTDNLGAWTNVFTSDHILTLPDATGTVALTGTNGGLLTAGTNITITDAGGTTTIASTGGATGANPTATIGTAAVNGSATTFMRSDAAPAFGNLTGDITSVGMATSYAGTVPVTKGGTGLISTPTDGQLLIGSTSGSDYVLSTLTAGSGVSITNSSGGITIAATGSGGTVTSISNSDGSLTPSPNPITSTGTLSLNVAHANTWTATQTFENTLISQSGTATSGSPVVLSPAQKVTGSAWNGSIPVTQEADYVLTPSASSCYVSWSLSTPSIVEAARLTSGGVFSPVTGFQINSASAANHHYLRGNGTNYVDGTIALGDLPLTGASTGSAIMDIGGSVAYQQSLIVIHGTNYIMNGTFGPGTSTAIITIPASASNHFIPLAVHVVTVATGGAPTAGTLEIGDVISANSICAAQTPTNTANTRQVFAVNSPGNIFGTAGAVSIYAQSASATTGGTITVEVDLIGFYDPF